MLRTRAPAAMASTVLTRRTAAITTSRSVPKRPHHTTPDRQQPRDEDAVHAVPAILRFDVRDGVWGEDVATQEAASHHGAMTACQGVDAGSRRHIRRPGERKHQPGIHHPTTGQERAQRHGDIRGDGWEDVFDGGQRGDEGVERPGGQLLEKRDEVLQETLLGSASVATASTAIPSPRPIQPMPSFVFAFTDTCADPASSASASFSSIASRWGASLGFSTITVTSAWTN